MLRWAGPSQTNLNPSGYSAFPSLAVQAGRWVVAYVRGSGHFGNDRHGWVAYSDDAGATWTHVELPDTGLTQHRPVEAIAALGNDQLLVAGRLLDPADMRLEPKAWVCRSNDNGATWETPVIVSAGFQSETPHALLVTTTGKVLLAVSGRNSQYWYPSDLSDVRILSSDDYGYTWAVGPTALDGQLEGRQYNETGLWETPDSTVWLAGRVATANIRYTTSTDDGATWAPSTLLTQSNVSHPKFHWNGTHHAGLIRHNAASEKGRWLVWSTNQYLTLGTGDYLSPHKFSYGDWSRLADGTVLAVWAEEPTLNTTGDLIWRILEPVPDQMAAPPPPAPDPPPPPPPPPHDVAPPIVRDPPFMTAGRTDLLIWRHIWPLTA